MGAEVIISPRGSVFASSTLREQYNNNRGKAQLTANVSPPTQTPQGQPCLTGVGNNPLTITKPSQRAVSRMPKARRSRLSLTRCAGWATHYNYPLTPRCIHPNVSYKMAAQTSYPSKIIAQSAFRRMPYIPASIATIAFKWFKIGLHRNVDSSVLFVLQYIHRFEREEIL